MRQNDCVVGGTFVAKAAANPLDGLDRPVVAHRSGFVGFVWPAAQAGTTPTTGTASRRVALPSPPVATSSPPSTASASPTPPVARSWIGSRPPNARSWPYSTSHCPGSSIPSRHLTLTVRKTGLADGGCAVRQHGHRRRQHWRRTAELRAQSLVVTPIAESTAPRPPVAGLRRPLDGRPQRHDLAFGGAQVGLVRHVPQHLPVAEVHQLQQPGDASG